MESLFRETCIHIFVCTTANHENKALLCCNLKRIKEILSNYCNLISTFKYLPIEIFAQYKIIVPSVIQDFFQTSTNSV